MWSAELFEFMADHSRPGAKVATFTVAGAVRRGLEASGFEVAKHPGFGRKRDCLRGTYRGQKKLHDSKPWYARPHANKRGTTVVVVGGGIAGATISHRLKEEGFQVTLYDRSAELASEASGNPAGLINPGLTLADDPIAHFREQACLHAIQYYNTVDEGGGLWRQSGVVQLASSPEAKDRQRKLIEFYGADTFWFEELSSQEASNEIGIDTSHPGLRMRMAGLVRPTEMCARLLEEVDLKLGHEVSHLVRNHDQWSLLGSDGKTLGEAQMVILANAHGAASFAQTGHFPLTQNRGQITYLPVTSDTKHMQSPVTFGGYLSPALQLDGQSVHVLGATYNEVEEPLLQGRSGVLPSDHQRNLDALSASFGIALPKAEGLEGRVSFRVRTPDRLPLVGPVPVAETYNRAYETVRYGNRFENFPVADLHDGLFVMAGFGSRGFQWAPLAAELLCAEIAGTPSPVSREVRELLHPARFLMRGLRRA
jgi:tRNA 5-methylaminomethyl-2-thiouridine biosynthesis bifunctional protein